MSPVYVYVYCVSRGLSTHGGVLNNNDYDYVDYYV